MGSEPMWKRILAWQMRPRSSPGASGAAARRRSVAARPLGDEILPAAVLAAQKAGVATQREFAKMMW